MSTEDDFFKKFVPVYEKLLDYGFILNENSYIYNKLFKNNEFRAEISITSDGQISGTVFDLANDEEYIPLKLKYSEGSFVGEVRTEYENILTEIRDNCFVEKYFLTPQANRLAELIFKSYNDKPAFMWDSYPTFGVFKNPKNNKWYGLIMNIDFSKIDKPKKGEVEVINIKLDTKEIENLLKQKGFYPAWHMNKKYWITITLNETLSDEEIMKYVEKSHQFTLSKKKK